MWFDTIFSVILSNGSPSRNAMTGYQIDVIRYLSYWARISFSSIRKYKYLDAAPLSSPSFIDLTWQPILSSFEERRGKPRTLPLMATDMASFSSYFERTWIGTSSTQPTYRHEMWNMPNLKHPPPFEKVGFVPSSSWWGMDWKVQRMATRPVHSPG